MQKLYPFLRALVLLASSMYSVAALQSCAATADLPATLSQPADSAIVVTAKARQVLGNLTTGRIKFKGPVTLQIGGAGNNASSTDASKAKAPVAAAPHAAASETKTAGGVPWQVYVGGALLVLGVGFYAGHRLKIPWPF